MCKSLDTSSIARTSVRTALQQQQQSDHVCHPGIVALANWHSWLRKYYTENVISCGKQCMLCTDSVLWLVHARDYECTVKHNGEPDRHADPRYVWDVGLPLSALLVASAALNTVFTIFYELLVCRVAFARKP